MMNRNERKEKIVKERRLREEEDARKERKEKEVSEKFKNL
jgi:hypothetical protein